MLQIAKFCRPLAVSVLFALSVPTAGQAQIFNWGLDAGTGNSQNSVADRQIVRFPSGYESNQIIVSFGDRRLYHIVARGRAISYPIAVPRPQSRWDGVERVSYKRINPPWTPTTEMRRENPRLPVTVRGGDPLNPLGSRAIYLGKTLYRIHGTDAPWTIGKNVSRGCIRMHNAHVEELYERVSKGMKVTSTWQRFRVQVPSDELNPIEGLLAAIFDN